jgi:hypothetical protein
MVNFHESIKEHRLNCKIDRDLVCKKAHINFQEIRLIESGQFGSVKADDLLSYLRVMGFKISAGKPKI